MAHIIAEQGCYPGCFYYTDSCFRKDCTMHSIPAHKQLDPAKKPGQIINDNLSPGTIDAQGEYMLSRSGNAKTYRPAHGGYPGVSAEERQAIKQFGEEFNIGTLPKTLRLVS